MVYPLISLGSLLSLKINNDGEQQWFCKVVSISSLDEHEGHVLLRVEWFWSREEIGNHWKHSEVKILGQLSRGNRRMQNAKDLTECMGENEVVFVRGHTDIISIGCVESACLFLFLCLADCPIQTPRGCS
jgi:hypothetical protein